MKNFFSPRGLLVTSFIVGNAMSVEGAVISPEGAKDKSVSFGGYEKSHVPKNSTVLRSDLSAEDFERAMREKNYQDAAKAYLTMLFFDGRGNEWTNFRDDVAQSGFDNSLVSQVEKTLGEDFGNEASLKAMKKRIPYDPVTVKQLANFLLKNRENYGFNVSDELNASDTNNSPIEIRQID